VRKMAKKKGIVSTFIDRIGKVFRKKPDAAKAKKEVDKPAKKVAKKPVEKTAKKPAKTSPPGRREQIVEETRLKLERLEKKKREMAKQPKWVKELDEQKKGGEKVPPKDEFLKPMFHKKKSTPKEEKIVDKKPEKETVKKEIPKKPAARKRSKFERSLGVEKKTKPAKKARGKRAKRKTKKKADETKKAITLPKIESKPAAEKVVPAKKPVVEKPKEEKIEEKPKKAKIVENPKFEKSPAVEMPASAVARAEPIRRAPVFRGGAVGVSQIEDFDEQITVTKELIKSLNMDFFKRRITEEEYRRKTLEYREKMKLLEIRRRNILKAQSGTPRVADNAREFAPVTATETKKAVSQTKVHQILRAKARGKIDDERLGELENKITELAKRYNLSEQELEQDVLNIDTNKTLESFNKLVSLIDLEREANRRLNQVRIVGVPKAFKESAKEVEMVKGIATEIKKHRIVTDFDKIISIVNQQGNLKLSKLSAQLKIDKKTCAGLLSDLEDEGLLELKYPAFGEVTVQIPGYDEMQKVIKEKKRAEEKARKLQEKQKKKNK